MVQDNARGIPHGKMPNGNPVLREIFGTLNTGGKYDNEGKYLGKKEISFHLKSKYARRDAPGNPWDKKLIYDKARKECYAQFTSDGTVTLKKIDLESGNVIATYILDDHYFPENIQVYDGTVYYQFIDSRMTFGKDCRSLYKMELY